MYVNNFPAGLFPRRLLNFYVIRHWLLQQNVAIRSEGASLRDAHKGPSKNYHIFVHI